MTTMRLGFFGCVFLVALSACSEESYLEQEERFTNYMKSNPLGETDYWIMSKTAFGGAPVGLIFGYPDDASACEEAVQMLNERHNGIFFCEAAN